MAIMDEKPGDLTIPQWLQILLMRRGGETQTPAVILGSLPNQSMSEFLFTLVTADEWSRHSVRSVVGAITLREWRGLAIRDQVLSRAATPAVKKTLARLIASSPDLPSADAALASSIKSGLAANDAGAPAKRQGIAARFEQDVQNDAAVMPLFKMRAYLYWRIHVIYMSLRNLVFKIHTDTPRPIPETTYHASLQLLELSLRYARSLGIGMVLYLAPVRPIQPNPTVPSDLARFRKDVLGLCEKYSATCLDYSDLVPERLWTNYPADRAQGEAGEHDYAHFTGPAHKLVADRLMADAGARLESAQ